MNSTGDQFYFYFIFLHIAPLKPKNKQSKEGFTSLFCVNQVSRSHEIPNLYEKNVNYTYFKAKVFTVAAEIKASVCSLSEVDALTWSCLFVFFAQYMNYLFWGKLSFKVSVTGQHYIIHVALLLMHEHEQVCSVTLGRGGVKYKLSSLVINKYIYIHSIYDENCLIVKCVTSCNASQRIDCFHCCGPPLFSGRAWSPGSRDSPRTFHAGGFPARTPCNRCWGSTPLRMCMTSAVRWALCTFCLFVCFCLFVFAHTES